MFFQKNTKNDSGSALVIALIVLAILTALGMAGLEVADLNVFMSANDRDSRNAFFHADSGANIGHELLEDMTYNGENATLYENSAAVWRNETVAQYNAVDFPILYFVDGALQTRIRFGEIETEEMEGTAGQMASGYEGLAKSGARSGTYTSYLIRSHRDGSRNSQAEVDLGWRHVNQ